MVSTRKKRRPQLAAMTSRKDIIVSSTSRTGRKLMKPATGDLRDFPFGYEQVWHNQAGITYIIHIRSTGTNHFLDISWPTGKLVSSFFYILTLYISWSQYATAHIPIANRSAVGRGSRRRGKGFTRQDLQSPVLRWVFFFFLNSFLKLY